MAEAIVSTILEHLTLLAIEKSSKAWSLVTGCEQQVKRLESNFEVLRYELADAEEKQFADKRVKLWLNRFQEVAYDMEDVLEDWKIALQQFRTTDGGAETSSASVSKWKVLSCLSCFSFGSDIVRRYDITARIDEINGLVEHIVKERVDFELIRREIKQPAKRQDSTSFVDVSELHGRDSAKEGIISALLFESGNNIPTIALVGMGGIGKTALAQLVYNDPRIQTHFDLKIWVCVSDPFDQIQIAQAILGVLNHDSIHPHSNPKLHPLLHNIGTKISGKKFFLVLEDMWTEEAQDWKPFKVAFQGGLLGSKILVTTRKISVAKQMAESSRIFHLDLLSKEACWLTLKHVAFSGRNENNEGENLEDIGREIAKKCKGLPLVAKTLGGLLKDKLRRQEWLNVLNSKIWKLDLAGKDIFAPLLLSYYDLPSQVRVCLLYCAVFPKDYRIRKYELIQHWMAQGYLSSNENLQIEKGEDYYDCLAAHSFFQDFEGNRFEGPSFKIHDIVHDFLVFLTQCEFVEEEVKCKNHLALSSEKARHLRLVIATGSHFPISLTGIQRLRSLVTLNNSESDVTGEAIQELLSVAKCLRLLEFGLVKQSSVKQIPDTIGKSIHLRYLGLRGSQIKKLPEAVCELCNLETLDLRECRDLETLPNGIGKLINLRNLSTECCTALTYYPKGISRLTSLVGLSDVIARVDGNDTNGFSFGDLVNLNHLRGDLSVKLGRVDAIDMKEVERAKLDKKEHLDEMHLITICREDHHAVKEIIVQALNPPFKLSLGDPRISSEVVLRKQP